MSSPSNSAVEPEIATSSMQKSERMLAGFPWVSAIVLYTLSWGWSLLRPNTLFWDDWEQFFRRSPFYVRQVYIDTGRPLWEGVAEGLLIQVGVWAICLATFLVFFLCGIFMFYILKTIPNLNSGAVNSLVILFLVLPVNTARISLVVFDYTSAYFLFYLGWFVLVRYKSTKSFVLACVILFLSFKTHSFLFFVLLPFLHFVWLNKDDLKSSKKLRVVHVKVFLIALLPIIYLLLRKLFWPPTKDWTQYHQIYPRGIALGLIYYVPFILMSFLLILKKSAKTKFPSLLIVNLGFFALGSAMFPYCAGNYFDRFSVFKFSSDWSSRHQLLMPLGLALSVVGLNKLFNWRKKNVVFVATIVLSVTLNMFWGSQYFLQSHKQEQLVELFKITKGKVEIASVADLTLRFNGRESTFRGYEWDGFMTLAGVSTDRPGCEALPSGAALTLKSNTPYLKALVTRNLGLYFEVKPCSEVLAENG